MNIHKYGWSHAEAVDLCRAVENIAPKYGCHVALTGGTLYKDGLRKDVDLLFYRVRHRPEIDVGGLFTALGYTGFSEFNHMSEWLTKAKVWGGSVDLFFPESWEPHDVSGHIIGSY